MSSLSRVVALAIGLAFGALAVGALAQAEAPIPGSRIEPRDCWFDTSGFDGVDCAALFVPQRWDQPKSTAGAGDRSSTYRLRVVRFRARDGVPTAEPVLFLSGGPGFSAVPDGIGRVRAWRRFADRMTPARDVILFDQRGTGKAYPRLDCPAATDPHVWAGLAEQRDQARYDWSNRHEALRGCLASYRELGRDLSSFNSAQNAADVNALRAALGADQVALFAQAYGTRLALTVMARYPETVSAAMLDSVQPPQAPVSWLDPAGFAASLKRLFAACKEHGNCGRAYPDLESILGRTLARLRREPVLLEVQNLKSRAPLFAEINDVAFLDIIFWEMHERPGLQTLPMLIAGFARGDHWRLRSHAENYFYAPTNARWATGMALSTLCREQFPLTTRQRQRSAASDMPFLINWTEHHWRTSPCHFWPVEPATDEEVAPSASDVPTLLLDGAFDPSAPLELAELAAETLPNSRLVVIPNGGHTVSSDGGCAGDLLFAFLADPTAAPDLKCLEDLPPPSFVALGGN